jgi:hypothetical protein
MTIVREEENGNNGHHAGDVWRGGRCPSSRDRLAAALARFGLIDRGVSDRSDLRENADQSFPTRLLARIRLRLGRIRDGRLTLMYGKVLMSRSGNWLIGPG